ncbi:M20/M25/M40 family metallo-hydrolase [uncultured Lamprocystis sp.]|jgi:acetylornithine deacetylase/succinyl-diaminopimelate desuccinylase-like protein|uniref:M20/M25/M40 family metallo-hydrolase n=1 Tax=uncultured Lamprocystis sp. TaxID=543132 RepID=UPI0025E3CF8B|nr:M20/M25/M40 family metallo-hydrolase [uncultured Lamprocystis sp.]
MQLAIIPSRQPPGRPGYRQIISVLLTTLFLFGAGPAAVTSWAAGIAEAPEPLLLVRIDVNNDIARLGLPVQANLVDAAGQEYILSMTTQTRLTALNIPYVIVDREVSDKHYLMARERRRGAIARATVTLTVLHNDGTRIVVRDEPGLRRQLGDMGFDLKLLRNTPMTFSRPARGAVSKAQGAIVNQAVGPDPVVTKMISQVTTATLNSYVSRLTGITPVTIAGSTYSMLTRNTDSGTPISKATRYVYDQLTALGLAVEYQDWSDEDEGYASRNVVGELTGLGSPDQIVLITAHLDDMPASGNAPGADDNASGTAAALLAARIMTGYRFERTIRFVFFTGEEQGLLGSWAYADSVADEEIVSVLNMDMMAYNTPLSKPTVRLHIRPRNNPGYAADLAIAKQFAAVVKDYGLSSALVAVTTADGDDASDHSSFWDQGFAAILAIEDDRDDFNPYYHTRSDTLSRFDLAYFRAFTQASVGTAAHLAGSPRLPTTLPDFVVASITLNPVSPVHGGIFTAAVTVKNSGNAPGDGRTLGLWLDRATTAPCDATGNGARAVGTVAAGAMKTLTFTSLPAGSAGTKTFRAFVDGGCDTKEAGETNNQTAKSYTVQ